MNEFNWKQYLQNYPDLRKLIKTKEGALNHWERYGKNENRTDKKIRYTLDLKKVPESELNFKTTAVVSKLPASIDLRNKLPPCYNQGNLGSCTANALVAAYQFLKPEFMGSRLFQYYNERVIEHDVPYDNGATITDTIKAAQTYGLCPETEWPYNINQFAVKPSTKCYTDAANHKVLKAYNVQQTLASMKGFLNAGFPFLVGILVYSSFETTKVNSTGMVPMPPVNKYDYILGGHCVLVCGYNDNLNGGMWIVRNSWGTSWGDHGYFYLPYAYLTNPKLCSDNWCVESET